MAKQKLKIKKPSPISFSKLTAPFKDENNQKIFAGVLILISLYLIIAFISFFFERVGAGLSGPNQKIRVVV